MINPTIIPQGFVKSMMASSRKVILTLIIASTFFGLNLGVAYSQPENTEDAPKTETPAVETPAPATTNTDDEDTSGSDGTQKTMLQWMIESSGPIFGPIFLLLSFVMVSLIIMNFLQIRRDVLIPPAFVEEFESKLNGKDYQGAYEVAKEENSPVANVLAAGMGNMNRGYNEALEAMQEVGEEESMEIEHKLSYLALIAAVAPMIGLMGTVYGMITSFRVIESSPVAPSPKELSGGIAKALFTTLEGLMVAIPAMIAYTILRNRSSRMMLDIGIISGRLMSRFSTASKGKPTTETK